jgi:hypothetical protein
MKGCLRITAGEPTPLQLSAWRRLWAILLAPVDSQSVSTVDECGEPETATPLWSHPEASEGPCSRTRSCM